MEKKRKERITKKKLANMQNAFQKKLGEMGLEKYY